MAYWNYRVLRKRHADGAVTYHIHEVHYGDDGSIDGWTEEPAAPMGTSFAELREDVKLLSHAFRAPVLEESDAGRRRDSVL